MSYEKPKRKNEDLPNPIWVLLQALWHYGVQAPLRGIWWMGRQSLRGLWWFGRQTTRGTWWFVKNAFQVTWAASVWAVKMPLRVMAWMWHLIMGLPPEFETQRETNIYRLIRRRYRRRNFFTFHTLIYALSMLTGAALLIDRYNHLLTARVDPWLDMGWAVIAGILWTMILAFHFVRLKSGENEDHDLHEALEREYTRQSQQAHLPIEEAYYHPRLALEEDTSDDVDEMPLETYPNNGTGKRKR